MWSREGVVGRGLCDYLKNSLLCKRMPILTFATTATISVPTYIYVIA